MKSFWYAANPRLAHRFGGELWTLKWYYPDTKGIPGFRHCLVRRSLKFATFCNAPTLLKAGARSDVSHVAELEQVREHINVSLCYTTRSSQSPCNSETFLFFWYRKQKSWQTFLEAFALFALLLTFIIILLMKGCWIRVQNALNDAVTLKLIHFYFLTITT